MPLLVTILALLLLCGPFTFAAAAPATSPAAMMPPTLTVSGEAEAAAKPNLAVVQIGAEVFAAKAQAAQEQVNELAQKTIAAIREVGIAEDEVQTAQLSLEPVYRSRQRPIERPGMAGPEAQELVGYRASNVVEVRVKDLSKVAAVIDAATAAGANRIQGIQFQLQDDTEPRKQALQQAAKRAREKAEALASATGVTIEGVEEVVEGNVQMFPMRSFAMHRGAMAAAEMATPVQPGQVRLTATVTVTYRIAPASK